MGKRIGIWILILLLPWAAALICREKNGKWDEQEILKEEQKQREAGQTEEAKKTGSYGAVSRENDLEMMETEEKVEADIPTEQKILIKKGDISTYLSLEDYLPGVVMRQIDPDFHIEALKCQAVIARTYIYRKMDGREEITEEDLDIGEQIKGIGATRQEREAWAERVRRCVQAVQETKGVVMTFEGAYILPLFHAASAGRTRKGEEDFPYLQSVESPWDQEKQEIVWNFSEFCELANKGLQTELAVGEGLAGQMQVVERDEAGYLKEMKLGMGVYSGDQIWYAFSLPSPCVTFRVEKDGIYGLVRGKGHGYGLSQAGANGMAKEGWGYREILQYYYNHIELIQTS